jgi:hypothetical protein
MRADRINSVTFKYNHPLKTLWKQGKLPQVKIGLYNNKLTKKNVSLEHELPVSKGGKSILENYALASREANSERGNDDIKKFLTVDMIRNYLIQFVNLIVKRDKEVVFDGNKYIQMQINNFKKLGFVFDK